jgi:hypothetical protein
LRDAPAQLVAAAQAVPALAEPPASTRLIR